jgi:hypothetical protein
MRAVTRDERRSSRAEWRRRWRSVPQADQKRIRDALRRGAAVDDPALAPTAVEAADHRLHGEEAPWPANRATLRIRRDNRGAGVSARLR